MAPDVSKEFAHGYAAVAAAPKDAADGMSETAGPVISPATKEYRPQLRRHLRERLFDELSPFNPDYPPQDAGDDGLGSYRVVVTVIRGLTMAHEPRAE